MYIQALHAGTRQAKQTVWGAACKESYMTYIDKSLGRLNAAPTLHLEHMSSLFPLPPLAAFP